MRRCSCPPPPRCSRGFGEVARSPRRKRHLILEPELVTKLYEWHGGQWSAVYSLASTGQQNLVSQSMIARAIDELQHTLLTLRGIRERRELEYLIDELEMVLAYPEEADARAAGMDITEEEYEYDRVDDGEDNGGGLRGSRRLPAGQAVREAAKRFWRGLSHAERWEIGDQLVMGSFDWHDWLDSPPPPGFLNALDQERMRWEVMHDG